MESKSHALMAGLFTLGLLIAVLLGGWWLNRDKTELVPYVMATRLSVAGLNPQATVRFRGLDVGKVSDIRFDQSEPGQILVFFGVRPETPMTSSTYGTLAYQGVTGIAYIELNDDGSNSQPLASSENDIACIEMRPGLMAALQTKTNSILDETRKLTKEMAMLFQKENQEVIIETLRNISKAAQELERTSRKLQPTLEKLPELADKTTKVMDNVAILSSDLKSIVGSSNPSESLSQLESLASDLDTLVQSLNTTVDQFNQRPTGILFGSPGPLPGPGEPGFSAKSN